MTAAASQLETGATRGATSAWLLAAISGALAVAGAVLAVAGRQHGLDLPADRIPEPFLELATAGGALLFGGAGCLLVRRVRDNAIGWLFLGVGICLGLMSVSLGYADLVVYGGRGWPGGQWAAWLASWIVVVPAFEAPCLIAQIFPDGRPLPGRWRFLLVLGAVSSVYLVLPAALGPGPLPSYASLDNPVPVPDWVGRLFLDPVWGLLVFALFGVSLVSIVVRFRRSTGTERQQLRWLTSVAGFTLVALIGAMIMNSVAPAISNALFALVILGIVATPVAVGVAVLRFRLYEIDRIISRTASYAALTLVLGALYAGLVVAGQAVFSSIAGGSKLAIAVSTLVVAALFQPVRARVQRAVDRRFNRSRYDAQRTLEAFGTRLRDHVERDALSGEVERLVCDTVAPSHVLIWVRGGGQHP